MTWVASLIASLPGARPHDLIDVAAVAPLDHATSQLAFRSSLYRTHPMPDRHAITTRLGRHRPQQLGAAVDGSRALSDASLAVVAPTETVIGPPSTNRRHLVDTSVSANTRAYASVALPPLRVARRAPAETLRVAFQMGSAESGSTIKVRSAGQPRAGRRNAVVRAPHSTTQSDPAQRRVNGSSPRRHGRRSQARRPLLPRCRWRSARPSSQTSTPTSAASRAAHTASPPR